MISEDGEQLLRYDEMLEEMKQTNTGYLARIEELETDGTDSGSLRDENRMLKVKVEHIKGNYDKLVEKCKVGDVELSASMERISEMEAEKGALESQVTKSSSELQGAFFDSQDLVYQDKTRENNTETAEQQLAKTRHLTDTIDNLTLKITQFEQEKASQQRGMEMLSADKSMLEQIIERFKIQQKVMNEESNQYRISFQRSNKLNIELNKQIRVLQKELNANMRRLQIQQQVRLTSSGELSQVLATNGSGSGSSELMEEKESRVTFSDEDQEIYNEAKTNPKSAESTVVKTKSVKLFKSLDSETMNDMINSASMDQFAARTLPVNGGLARLEKERNPSVDVTRTSEVEPDVDAVIESIIEPIVNAEIIPTIEPIIEPVVKSKTASAVFTELMSKASASVKASFEPIKALTKPKLPIQNPPSSPTKPPPPIPFKFTSKSSEPTIPVEKKNEEPVAGIRRSHSRSSSVSSVKAKPAVTDPSSLPPLGITSTGSSEKSIQSIIKELKRGISAGSVQSASTHSSVVSMPAIEPARSTHSRSQSERPGSQESVSKGIPRANSVQRFSEHNQLSIESIERSVESMASRGSEGSFYADERDMEGSISIGNSQSDVDASRESVERSLQTERSSSPYIKSNASGSSISRTQGYVSSHTRSSASSESGSSESRSASSRQGTSSRGTKSNSRASESVSYTGTGSSRSRSGGMGTIN
jgi:uncharacterized protein (UPF0335 family)